MANGQLPLATKIIALQKSDTKSQAVSATELKMAEYEVVWEHGSPPISCLLACKRLVATHTGVWRFTGKYQVSVS